ncbi:hypothetical protein IMY05_008G0035500 [Salix suchowensis]|nr:hypothetical protein IMY05_008G0035500 [Salix suchowensis]
MEDKYQEREKRPGSARIPPRRGQIKARILRKLVQKPDWTDGSLFCFWDKTSLISEFANITRSFCFLFSFSASVFMLLAEWHRSLPVILHSSSPVTFKASFLSFFIPCKHTPPIFSQIRSMDSKNGTPKEKGNASLPPRRGQIKDKIGKDLKTFIAGWAGKRSDEDGGNKSVTYLPESGSCSE